jgi:hypothetical protein
MKHMRLLLLGVFLALTGSNIGIAHANIAFESYEVGRPDVAEVPVGAFLNELTKLGYVANSRDVIDQLGSQAATPALANPKLTAQKLLAQLGSAHTLWTKASDFRKLAPVLQNAVTTALANSALLVTDPTIRNAFRFALLDLALVYSKLADERQADAPQLRKSSEEIMAEWIRTFRDEVITKEKGPEAEGLYVRVRNERNKLGRGVLSVSVDDPDVLLYVNEAIRSRSQPIPDLPPGPYRVLLMGPDDDARLFNVEVLPNQTTRLDIQWAVSSNLVAGSSFVGFVFASSAHPEASKLACQLAKVVGHVSGGVVLVGMRTTGQTWSISASLYDARTCQLIRGGRVAFYTAVSSKGGRALARFIAQRVHDPDVIVTTDIAPAKIEAPAAETAQTAPVTPVPVATAAVSRRRSWWAWSATAGSAASFVVGGYGLYRYYGKCGQPLGRCPNYYAYSDLAGYGGVAAGIALGAVATYLFLRETRASGHSNVTLVPRRGGAFVGWTGRF